MKTNKTIIFAGFILLASALFIFSCDVPLALGNRLDIEGPLVEFISPAPRTAVQVQFDIEGRVSDESPIKELLIKASLNNEDFPKQWRYLRSAGWQVSENYGQSWDTYPDTEAQWNGSEQRADWMISIDMGIGGSDPEDGEYLFAIQAWDLGGFTDDNSYKTRVLILDRYPPTVSVSNPYLYNRHAVYNPASESFNDAELQSLHAISDDGIERKDPAMLGKFITQDFPLQWQIEDSFDVWSIDLRLYSPDVQIDGEPGTPLPDNYIFSYHQNLPPSPENPPDPFNTINPNGNITVPALEGDPGFYDGGHLKNPIAGKTTVRVVAVCFDSAENPNEEKTLGFFVYWPKADWPWIAFSDGMEEPGYYTDLLAEGDPQYGGSLKTLLEMETFMIYPGRTVKSTAFHAHGLTKVEYSLYAYNEETGVTSPAAMDGYNNILIDNPQRPNGSYSTVFPWEFTPPPRTGYYVVKATSYSVHKSSEEHVALFRVQDISFPNFPIEPSPSATEPLFKFIGRPENADSPDNVPDNHIRISGVVSDATEIVSLSMVWINPVSRNYAAMSQLQYFRDSSYAGWAEAKKLSKGGTDTEKETTEYPGQRYPYDPPRPNRLWNLEFNDEGIDIETGRRLYTYSIPVDLDDLNIGIGNQPLSSQIFLLRAENPDGKCTIITYAPQGDTLAPTITINKVVVSSEGAEPVECIPGEYQLVPKFSAEDNKVTVITVTGEWEEDSTGYLDVKDYLNDNMEFSINGFVIRDTITALGINVTKSPSSGNATSGTFTIVATVREEGSALTAGNMKDTLAVNVSIRDIGGNPSEAGASWLIENDNLRFLRISSLDEDKAYKDGDEIEIYMEFNKPVTLKPGRNQTPVLTLNTEGGVPGRATYKAGQGNESTRHFFTYEVKAGQNTTGNLNVNGLSIDGGIEGLTADSTAWQDNGYPFTWVYTGVQGDTEEIRITRTSGHDGSDKITGYDFYVRALPVNPDKTNITNPNGPNYNPDYPFTLIGGKRITVDNQAPTITGFTASPKGWHRAGVEVYITATFSEAIRLGSSTPYLILGTGGQTSTDADDIRLNNNQITFKYTVGANDNTGTAELEVTNFGGQVLDVPGTPMAADAVTGMSNKTLEGVYLDTIAPVPPVVSVHSGNPPANQIGISTGAANLGNLYHENLYIRITGTANSGPNTYENLGRIEYSLNNGGNWTSVTSATYDITVNNNGVSNVLARQTDRAGNLLGTSNVVNFNWDKGALVSSINSFTPNGTYTYNSVRQTDRVDIQVNFRKALTFSGDQQITLNVNNGTKNVTTSAPAGAVSQLTFTYSVVNNDTTNGARLAVTGLSLNATDGGTNVPSAFINTLPVTANRLETLKNITIQTGGLTAGTPAFNNGSLSTTGGVTAGIQTDGTYNTALVVNFNSPIYKNEGNITITQLAADYRVPAVLTEAQYNKYRDITDFNTYYTRGTNGYIGNDTPANGAPDTSTKFVLAYNFDPAAPTAGAQTTFTEAFRQAEKIQLSVNSSAVRINGSQLIIDLAGANALQVPGASYEVVIDANFVQDALSNRSVAISQTGANALSVGGVAKPVIRVLKRQDTITVNTPNATTPRFTAAQPFTTTVRMDTRTPGANIYYNTSRADTDTAAVNWTSGAGPGDTANPATFTRPGLPTNTGTQYTAEITIGTTTAGATPTIANVQGLRWHVRARAYKDTTYSTDSEEMAYRTVLTYAVTNMNTSQGQNFNSGTSDTAGNQVWIRGGDGISVSSTPGFPLTWEDNFDTLKADRKRAGTRLLTLTATPGTNLNTSTWRWVTWEVNVDVYFDIIMGYDPNTANGTDTNVVNVVTQYGPRQWAMQRAGWSSFKNESRILPGKHRWMVVTNGAQEGKGSVNFTSTFQARPAMTGEDDVTWTP